jgi:hypothetical protein
LTVGRLLPHKNIEVLIAATRMLTEQGFDLSVQHVGSSSEFIERNYLRKLRSLSGPLGDRFRFLGFVNQVLLNQCYRESDVVIIPSLHEGYSLPAREALVHRKPVIASKFGALPETLDGCGRFFHPLDAVELSNCLKEVANLSDEGYEDLCMRAGKASTVHSPKRYLESCVDVIENTMATGRRGSKTCERPTSDATTYQSSNVFVSHSVLENKQTRVRSGLAAGQPIDQAEGSSQADELRRLHEAILGCYSPKTIVASGNGIVARIKAKVASAILKLVYHAFIGPQMAVMQSQLRLLQANVASWPDQPLGERSAAIDNCSIDQDECTNASGAI